MVIDVTMKGRPRSKSEEICLYEVKDGKIILENNFSFDGAPDPRVSFGKGGTYSKNTDFAVLKKNNGKQTYKIPSNLNADDYDTVVIWCRKFSVPLGYAKIK